MYFGVTQCFGSGYMPTPMLNTRKSAARDTVPEFSGLGPSVFLLA